jgi:hypothetical protein
MLIFVLGRVTTYYMTTLLLLQSFEMTTKIYWKHILVLKYLLEWKWERFAIFLSFLNSERQHGWVVSMPSNGSKHCQFESRLFYCNKYFLLVFLMCIGKLPFGSQQESTFLRSVCLLIQQAMNCYWIFLMTSL